MLLFFSKLKLLLWDINKKIHYYLYEDPELKKPTMKFWWISFQVFVTESLKNN